MALKTAQTHHEIDLFRMELVNQINLRHPLVKLAQIIDWADCEREMSQYYALDGRPGHQVRRMVGLECLKQMHGLSDEAVVAMWIENPYWQYFCGEQYFQHDFPTDPSNMSYFRKRIGKQGCEYILTLTVKAGLASGTVTQRSLQEVNVDTTVQEKAITFPTDAKLLHKARIKLVAQAKKLGINLRQSYERVGKTSFIKSVRYAHARQFKRANAAKRKLKTFLGRVIRDIERKATSEQKASLKKLIHIAQRIHDQKRQRSHNQPKIYSIHAPEVECISKGKAHKPYEFGVKVSIVSSMKDNFVIGAQAHHGTPYDGHTLEASLRQARSITNVDIKHVNVDKGYRGHKIPEDLGAKVWISGAKKGVTPAIKCKLNRRNAIEPIIGHMKSDGRLGRNFLKGELGDELNVLLCAVGHNLRKILKKLWLFLRLLIRTVFLGNFSLRLPQLA